MTTADLTPIADAYTFSGQSADEFGKDTSLYVSGNSRTYLRYSMSGLPADAEISDARLRFTVNYLSGTSTADPMTVGAGQVTTSWSETSINWGNQPAYTDLNTSMGIGAQTVYEVDVTATVQGWLVDAVNYGDLALFKRSGGGEVGSSSREGSGTAPVLRVTYTANVAPNAPTLVSPADGATIDRGVANVFTISANDPDDGDSTSKSFYRTRPIGETWTTVSRTSTVTTYTFPDDHFVTLGNYEWQAATRDAAGLPSEDALVWSTSGFFTVGDSPNTPEITAPTAGATIPTESVTVTISAPDVDEAEYRLYADNGGAMGTTQLQPAQVVTTGDKRQATWTGLANGTSVWLWVRTSAEGLWSSPAAQLHPVSYTAPATPAVEVDTTTTEGAMRVRGVAATPSGSEPEVTHFDVYRREGADTGDGIRRAAGLAPSAVFTDWFVASGIDYFYRVQAFGVNGTSTWSDWSGAPTTIPVETYGGY